MQALICRQFGPIDTLEVGEILTPVAAAGQILIDVAAASINYPDGLMVQGKYQAKPELPFVPRREPERAAEQVTQLLQWLEETKVRPLVGATFSLNDAKQALATVLERRAVGKVIIVPSS